MLYEKYYGFIEKPYQVAPNPRYLYLSSKHQNALTYLEYGISEGDGFVLLTGDIGTGKTLLIKKLLSGIGSDLEVAVIFSTKLDADQLIHLVLNEFEIAGQFNSKAFALDALYQFLVTKFNQNKRVILIIDEAQNLPLDALEEVRMMSNIQSDTQSLIQIFLVGQPELKNILATPSLSALTQRISWHYHLGPLSRAETSEYIDFRLKVAGRKTKLFTAEAVDLIYRASSGIPRTINILCENSLVYGFADEFRMIERSIVAKVLSDRRALKLPVPPQAEPASSTPVVAENQSNGMMERIIQVEKALSDRRAMRNHATPQTETASSEPAMTQIEADGMERIIQVEKVLSDRHAMRNHATPQAETASSEPAMTQIEADDMVQRIFELEERINKFTRTPPEVIESPVESQTPQNPLPKRHPTAPALKWTTAKARIYALNKTNSLPMPPQPSAAATPPAVEVSPEARTPEPRTIPVSPPAKASPAPQVSRPKAAAPPLSFIITEPEPARLPTAARLGGLVLIVLFITFAVWVLIPDTGEQERLPQQAQTPLEKNPDQPPDPPADSPTNTPSPPGSESIAATSGSLPANASLPATTPMPLSAVAQNESDQPPAVAAGMPPARSVSAISEKSEPAGNVLSEAALKLQSQLQRDKKIVINLNDDSNNLQLDTFTILEALAELLIRQPDSQVVFLGFTDASSGGRNGSQKFGEFQADVVNSFLEGKGIKKNRIKTYGLEPTFMVVSNDSENSKQTNQRVEIRIIPLPAREASPQPQPQ